MKQSLTPTVKQNKYYPHRELRNFWRIVFITIVLGLIYFHSPAQEKDSIIANTCYQDIAGKPVKIADETFMTQLKASIKIETSNENIYNKLMTLPFKGIRVSDKKDRNGAYKNYAVYFRKEDMDIIRKWIAKL